MAIALPRSVYLSGKMRLATKPADDMPEVISEFVEAPDLTTATRLAKLAMIQRGRTPGHPVIQEDLGEGQWEIGFTDRPLRPDQSFNQDGVRTGNAGTKADRIGSRR